MEQGASGAVWQLGAGHTLQMSYGTNASGEVSIWEATETGASITSTYAAGTLYKNHVTDENGHESIEYKDLQGKVILKKGQDGPGTYVSTYYVYDDLDNLRFVIPPKVTVSSFDENTTEFKQLIYGYKYDGRNRLIRKKIPGKGWESIAQNHLNGTDHVVNTYRFTGELERSVRTHNSSTVTDLVITNAYTYDHMNRRKQSKQQTGLGNANVLLSELEYTETGQLLHKKLHNNLQDVAYSYNERGWLNNQHSALFSQTLRYANPQLGATAQYNGNISEQVYTAPTGGTQTVTYGYDAMNRLISGNSSSGYSETGITYDKMGNLLTLNRSGMGSLSYDLYEGNQLKTLSGYKNGTFSYNLNGNLDNDGMRGMTIGYNYLNQPNSVSGNVTLSYVYDATGRKLRKVSSTTGTSDYVNGIHYEDNVLKFIQTQEGRAIKSGTDYNYEYTLTDHLGNNRVTFDTFGGTANQVGEEDYYPFGLNVHRQLNAGNHYLYNGKELQEELG